MAKSTQGLIDKWHRLQCGDTKWRDEQEKEEFSDWLDEQLADAFDDGMTFDYGQWEAISGYLEDKPTHRTDAERERHADAIAFAYQMHMLEPEKDWTGAEGVAKAAEILAE